MENTVRKTSKIRKLYIFKLVARCIILVLGVVAYFVRPSIFHVMEGMNFFREFSILHLLWVVWILDMLYQLIPSKGMIPLGSQKHFHFRFKPLKEALSKEHLKTYKDKLSKDALITYKEKLSKEALNAYKERLNKDALKAYIVSTTKAAYMVFIIWILLTLALGTLKLTGIIDQKIMILISMCFFVCDLICVLIWCPFRLLMKTRCCTTCRIFNWDHLMMFAHLIFAGGFYCLSLFAMSILVFIVWELSVLFHPERFWEITNTSLRCSECTDKLCSQYCKKLRK